jgi:hypothetical protein
MNCATTKSIFVVLEDENDDDCDNSFNGNDFEAYLIKKEGSRLNGYPEVKNSEYGLSFEDDCDEFEDNETYSVIEPSPSREDYDEWAEVSIPLGMEIKTEPLFHCDIDEIGIGLTVLEREFDEYGCGKVGAMHDQPESEVDREYLMDPKEYNEIEPNMDLRNYKLYEFYCMYRAVQDHGCIDEFGKKIWRTLRLALRMGNCNYCAEKTIARKSINYRFEQYFNLMSQVFGWRMVMSYPYYEHIGLGTANIIGFAIVMSYEFYEEPTITVKNMTFIVDFTHYMHGRSLTELLCMALVSKGFYKMVKNFVRPIIRYYDHIKSYGYGRGLYDNANAAHQGQIEGRSALRARMGYADWICDDCPNCIDLYNLGDDTIASSANMRELEEYYNTTIRVTDRTYSVCEPYLSLRDKTFSYVVKYFPVLLEGTCVLLVGDVIPGEKSKEFWVLYDFYNRDYHFYYMRPFVIDVFAHVYSKYDQWQLKEYDE